MKEETRAVRSQEVFLLKIIEAVASYSLCVIDGVIGEGPDVEITHSKAAGFNSWLKARGKEKPMVSLFVIEKMYTVQQQ